MKPRVFLTGATGTVGSAVLEALRGEGAHEVDCLVRRAEDEGPVRALGAMPVRGDMTDRDLTTRIDRGPGYDFIIHAAQAHYGKHTDAEIAEADLKAVELLQALRSERTRLMIYTSGIWIFGNRGQSRIGDSTPFQPFAADALRADFMRQLLAQTRYPWAHLCPPSIVYGSRGPYRSIVQQLRKGPIDVIDDEAVLWSVIERSDLGRAYLAMLQHARAGDLHVVAEDEPVAQVAFYERTAQLAGGSVTRRPRAFFEASCTPSQLETLFGSQPVDSAGIKRACGWKARTTFEEWAARHLPAMD